MFTWLCLSEKLLPPLHLMSYPPFPSQNGFVGVHPTFKRTHMIDIDMLLAS